MRKNNFIFASFLLFVCSCSYGQDMIIGAMKKVKIFDIPDGRLVATYEDVSNINIQPKFDGCSIPSFNYSDLPSSPIRYTDRNNYLSKITPGAIIPDPPSDGQTFLENNFYLDFGYEGADGWVSRVVGKNGSPNMDSQDPGRSPKIWYCLDGTFKVVRSNFSAGSLSISADGVSCKVAQHLCPLGKDNCSHLLTSNNVIKNLRSIVEGKSGDIEDSSFDAASLQGKGSGIFGQIVFKDRTPPWIDQCDGGKFPKIGDSKDKKEQICTGDWFVFDKLKIKENDSKKVQVKISLGKIDECPKSGSEWTKDEKWVDGNVQFVSFGDGSGRKEAYMDSVISAPPNNCYGYMRYTVFAEDYGIKSESKGQIGNLNPGCATIIEDKPNICYGLPKENKFGIYEDLSTSPGDAKAWPIRANRNDLPEDIAAKMSIKGITGDYRVHEGYIRISDNDLPNILIRLKSAKYGDEKQIFFPPCMPAGGLNIEDSPDFNNRSYNDFPVGGLSNHKVYDVFVGDSRNILKECNYQEVIKSRKRPYFTIYDLVPSDYMNDKDKSYRSKFLNNEEPAFINKHFRLEDHSCSDTIDYGEAENYGKPDERLANNGESLLGKRNGTWKKVVALVENLDDSEVEIQEDVEYELGVWVDDSVKWANSYPNEYSNENLCESVNIPIPTGIKKGKITIDIPNQVPPYHREYEFPQISYGAVSVVESSVQEPIRVVFREPTDNKATIDNEDDLINNKFPSITVEASDYADNDSGDNKRIIKLYFRVKDENAKIKTLQRKHQQY